MADPPTHLPRLAKDYTPEQTEACIDYLTSLGTPELRRRLVLWREQRARAEAQGNAELIEDMRLKEDQIIEAGFRAN